MSSFPYPNWLWPVCSHPLRSPHFSAWRGIPQSVSLSGKGGTLTQQPYLPLSQISVLSGLCRTKRWAVGIPQWPWRQAGPPAAVPGTSSTATSWGQVTCDSYRPDIPLTPTAGGKGCCPARAHPAGAAQSQGSWRGVFALSHTSLCHPSLCWHFSHYFQTPGLAWAPRTSLERWGQPKEQLGLAPARATAEAAAPWPAPSWQGAAPRVSISSDLALNSMQIQPDCSLTWAGRNAHDKGVH